MPFRLFQPVAIADSLIAQPHYRKVIMSAFKAIVIAIALCAANCWAADESELPSSDTNAAKVSALADSLTTYGVIASGGAEVNPLIGTTPVGLLALVGAKLGMIEYVNNLPPAEREEGLDTLASIWGGVSANNLAVLLFHSSPIGMLIGGITSSVIWQNRTEQRRDDEQAQALRALEQDVAPTNTASAIFASYAP
jgi:hypothetical protein